MSIINIVLAIEIDDRQEASLAIHGLPQRVLLDSISQLVEHRGLKIIKAKGSLERSSSEYMKKLRDWTRGEDKP